MEILDYMALIINYLKRMRLGGVREVLDRYPYFINIIKLWPGDWVTQMEKMNQAVGEKNNINTSVGRKRPARNFTRNEFWKCIRYILPEVTFGVKGHHIWGKPEASISKKGLIPLQTPLHRDIHGKTYLLKVRCYLYHPH